MANNEEGSLLVVVIDVNPSVSLLKNGDQTMVKCLNSIIVLCNTHLMMSSRNDLAVIACTGHKSVYLYPSPSNNNEDDDKRPTDGQYELLSWVGSSIKDGMKNLVQSIPQDSTQTESLLAGSMSMALCYIHRIQRSKRTTNKENQSHILVLTSSGDNASQYMNFMNVFFTAQKYGVTVDTCVINKDAGILQQGCDITDGVYLKIPNLGAFVQYLLWVFLPDVKSRKELVLPARVHVDYRAACFCHRNLIEIGYVCSVCLSIFCSFSPICSTCQTAFKFMGPMANLKPKKKKLKLT